MESNKYKQAVEKLKDLLSFLEEKSLSIDRRFITANIGEWMVMHKLTKRGCGAEHKSGQYSADIELKNGIQLEVKASTRKKRRGGLLGVR